MPTIRLNNVSKSFDRIQALEDIYLEVKEGEYLFILGPSGCGKTTLINCITGIVAPSNGEIFFDNLEVNSLPIEEREFAMVFQSIALFPHMTVEQNVSYGPFVRDESKAKQAEISDKMLRLVDLLEEKQLLPRTLSGGAQQKTAVARALANEQKLLMLDEPISALDHKVRVALRYELRRLVKELGLTAIHITHDQEEAMSIADRIVILRAGKIVEIGTPQELYENPKSLFTMNFVGEANFLEGTMKQKIDNLVYRIEFRNTQCIELSVITGDFEEDESVIIAFRPENVEILFQDQLDTLPGKVVNKQFTGGYIRYEVELLTDDTIIIDSRTHLDKNQKVFIKLDPKSTKLFAAPEFGLRKVLLLE
ncbi:MAG: ABC transporter ATP-binding protein [Candidatus Hodarchaeales archaeon]|jgi:ABC-type Fe3+/spermidine/putrescine transport system ATPase subunit